jgi:hypothetical protein
MRIAYKNKIDDLLASQVTALTENVLYPIENVQDQRLSVKYQTDGASIQSVIFNLGVATTVTVAAILGHDIPSGTTCIIQGNGTNVWTSPSVNETFTVSASTESILKFFTGGSYQYWRFYFTTVISAINIGRLWLGEYITIDPSSLLDFNITKMNDDNVTFGKGRQKFATRGIGWRKFELNFPDTNYSMIKKIEDMYDEVGKHSSLLFCNFDTIRNYQIVEPCYCSIEGDLQLKHSRSMKFSYSLVLEENL